MPDKSIALMDRVAEKFLDNEYSPAEFITMTEAAYDKYGDTDSMTLDEAFEIIESYDDEYENDDDISNSEFIEAAITNVAEGLSDPEEIVGLLM